MKMHFKTLIVYVGLTGSVLSSAAFAQCELKKEWKDDAARFFQIQIPPSLTVIDSTDFEEVIWRTPVPVPAPQEITNRNNCNGKMNAWARRSNSQPDFANNVYRTNVRGIGYRIVSKKPFPFELDNNSDSWQWPNSMQMEDLEFQLIRTTEQLEYGKNIASGRYGLAVITPAEVEELTVFQIIVAAGGGAIKKSPCMPDPRNLIIPLGRISTDELRLDKGRFNQFSVELRCDQKADITVNINANSDAPQAGLINADAGSQAKGVVVELQEREANGNNTPFKLNTDRQYGNNGTDNTVLNFRARLKMKSATEAIVTGEFSASATMKLSYE